MKATKIQAWVFVLILGASLLAGCGGAPASATLPAAGGNLPANAGPIAAGDWAATTDFGSFVFTVAPGGMKISKLSFQFADKWVCGTGPNTDRPARYVTTITSYPITNGAISLLDTIDADRKISVKIDGSYSAYSQIFSGTWEEDLNGSKCNGEWKAILP